MTREFFGDLDSEFLAKALYTATVAAAAVGRIYQTRGGPGKGEGADSEELGRVAAWARLERSLDAN